MATYNPSAPNAFDNALIPFKVRQRYFEEYLGLTPLTVFMGTSASDAIQIFEMENGEGMSYRVSFRKDLNYENPILGFDQAEGAEQKITIYEDEITLQLQRFVDVLMGVPIVKKQTPIDVYDALRPLLMNAQRRNLVKSILDSGTTGLYNPANGGTGPTTNRVIYGVGGGTANVGSYAPTIYEALNAMSIEDFGTTDVPAYSNGGLSVDHIRKLKSMAINGGKTYEVESRIKPVELKTKKGFPEECYIYLMDPDSYVSLAKDPQWTDFVYRGVIQNADQPEGISGARYRGMVEGVMVYECPELSKYKQDPAGDQSRFYSWNLFCGAQAFGLCWSRRPWFEMEQRDFNLNVAMAVAEIRGQKAFMFPSFQNPTTTTVERGIIHSFVRTK